MIIPRKNLILKDGTTMPIEPVNDKDDIRQFQRFINILTKEAAYLLIDKPVTLTEEINSYKHGFKRTEKRTDIP